MVPPCFVLPLHSHRCFVISAVDGVDNLNNSIPTAHPPFRHLTSRLVSWSERHSAWTAWPGRWRHFDPPKRWELHQSTRSSIWEDMNLEHASSFRCSVTEYEVIQAGLRHLAKWRPAFLMMVKHPVPEILCGKHPQLWTFCRIIAVFWKVFSGLKWQGNAVT
jgi:hypothetical protein